MVNQQHLDRLLEGVEEWNLWRQENPHVKPDLRGARIFDMQLNCCNFRDADLRHAVFFDVDLTDADFSNALVGEAYFISVVGLTQIQKLEFRNRGVKFEKYLLDLCPPLSPGSVGPHIQEIRSGQQWELFDWSDNLRRLLYSYYAYAEMDDRVVINCATSIEVIISKELLTNLASSTSQSGEVKLDPDKSLIVQVIPKTNFITLESDRIEINPPEKGKPHYLYFDLKATNLGEGEVWVVLRHGQMSLLTLILRPIIVENRAALRTVAAMQLVASSPASAPPASPSQRIRTDGRIIDLFKPATSLHQLRIIERQNGNQITYLYELNSPPLGLLSLHESRPITSDRYAYVENLYKEIESRWLSTQGDLEDFSAELRAFGGQLFDQLFPEKLQQQLWEYRNQIDSIMVLSTEPFIPWELVHLKPPGQTYLPDETCFLAQMGVVRWLHDVGFPPEWTKIRRGSARYIIPQYPIQKYQLPQAEQEAQFLEQHFSAIPINAQPADVRQLLKNSAFDILHFAGHGLAEQDNIGNAKLLLEGRIENNQYVHSYLNSTTVEQFCNFHERDRNERPIIVLNACQVGREGYLLTGMGGFAQAFLRAGAGVFVGPLWSVGDRPARMFTETLYSSLIDGKTLAQSTIAAREAAKLAGDSTWLAYAVYGHPHLKLKLT